MGSQNKFKIIPTSKMGNNNTQEAAKQTEDLSNTSI